MPMLAGMIDRITAPVEVARHRPGSSCLPLQLRVMAMPPASRSPHGAVGHAIEVLMARICRTVRRLVLREFP